VFLINVPNGTLPADLPRELVLDETDMDRLELGSPPAFTSATKLPTMH
jgi:hypothetical protein